MGAHELYPTLRGQAPGEPTRNADGNTNVPLRLANREIRKMLVALGEEPIDAAGTTTDMDMLRTVYAVARDKTHPKFMDAVKFIATRKWGRIPLEVEIKADIQAELKATQPDFSRMSPAELAARAEELAARMRADALAKAKEMDDYAARNPTLFAENLELARRSPEFAAANPEYLEWDARHEPVIDVTPIPQQEPGDAPKA